MCSKTLVDFFCVYMFLCAMHGIKFFFNFYLCKCVYNFYGMCLDEWYQVHLLNMDTMYNKFMGFIILEKDFWVIVSLSNIEIEYR